MLYGVVSAQLIVTVKTGGDDLRGGQMAYIQLVYKTGTVSQEFELNSGAGWGDNSSHTKTITVPAGIKIEDIEKVRVRYDGSPRNLTQTYDNWNLESLLVKFNRATLAQCSGTPWHRFKGESTVKDCKVSYIPPVKGSFSGCWDSEWSTCHSNGKIAGGAKLSFKQDPHNSSRWYGAWTGTADDSKGYRHCGFLFGTLKGNVLTGTWYEVIYKDNRTCTELTYSGTFQFRLLGNSSFSGTYTDTNGPCKGTPVKMVWNGKR